MSSIKFKLQFPAKKIRFWSEEYDYPSDIDVENVIAPAVRARGYYTRDEFLDVCRWKSPRTKPSCEKNSDEFVEEVTKIALPTEVEQLRIEVLTLLEGVSWPTASVLLHFGSESPYPILDFRALWSLGWEEPPSRYKFDFWWKYTKFCRDVAEKNSVSMRTLDRALWQYSKKNQTVES